MAYGEQSLIGTRAENLKGRGTLGIRLSQLHVAGDVTSLVGGVGVESGVKRQGYGRG